MKDRTASDPSLRSVQFSWTEPSMSGLCAAFVCLASLSAAHGDENSEQTAHRYEQAGYTTARLTRSQIPATGDDSAHAPFVGMPDSVDALEPYPNRRLDLLREAADRNQPEAELELGNRYYAGDGVPQDFAAAVDWWHRAAEHGSIRAAFNLGLAHAKAIGVAGDNEHAKTWLARAANGGMGEAWFALAVLQLREDPASAEYGAACSSFEHAANSGLPNAQYNIGAMQEAGIACTADLDAAIHWYRRAAASGVEAAVAALTRLQVSETGAAPIESRPLRDPAWVRGQDPNHYTIQVANGISASAITDILERYDSSLDRACFPVHNEAARRYLALLGSFRAYADAAHVVDALEPELTQQKPWIRRFASVQALAHE